MEIKEVSDFIKYYERINFRTRRLLDYIPPNKIEWSYQEGKFTIGDIIRHIANIERYMYAENVQLKNSSYSGCGEEFATSYSSVLEYYDQLHEESKSIFSRLSNQDLINKCTTPGNIEIKIWKWLRAMIEHHVHHRGQLYMYLGLLGIKTPPLFGMTSEQVSRKASEDD